MCVYKLEIQVVQKTNPSNSDVEKAKSCVLVVGEIGPHAGTFGAGEQNKKIYLEIHTGKSHQISTDHVHGS